MFDHINRTFISAHYFSFFFSFFFNLSLNFYFINSIKLLITRKFMAWKIRRVRKIKV